MEKDFGYRRVQSTGRGSFIISLPKEWVKEIGLNKGSEISFQKQKDSSIVLVPRKLEQKVDLEKTKLREYHCIVDQGETLESTRRKTKSLYAVGADIIRIHFKNMKDISKFKNAIKSLTRDALLGSEIIEETSDEVVVQILIRHSDFPIEKAVRRMSILALSANKDAILALKSGDSALFQSIIASHKDVNRLGLYVVRQLKFGIERNLFQELGFRTPKEFLLYRILVNDIDSVADEAIHILNRIAAFKKLVDNEILFLRQPLDEEVYSQLLAFNSVAHQLFEASIKAMFKRDFRSAEKIIAERESVVALEHDLTMLISSKKLDPNIAAILDLILGSSTRIMDYSKNTAELTLNRTVEDFCLTLSFKGQAN
ncbi:phosphate uptake regulator PhoU [Candidatus Bathyarchaeota archaeon]|nr:phosphate uptake regulator PhoU [Candidatus Bathyarchaeota archaeon]